MVGIFEANSCSDKARGGLPSKAKHFLPMWSLVSLATLSAEVSAMRVGRGN